MKQKILKLPINIDEVECVTECWTFNRMAILKTLPYYEDWIASHYDLHATSNFNFFFGQNQIYTPDYYDIILNRKFINLFELTESDVVDRLKDELSKGYYLILYFKPLSDVEWYHEVLIFGFDDMKKVFHCIGLEKRIFQEKEYDYTYMKDALKAVKKHIKENKKGINLGMQFQYALSAFQPKDDYCTDNCVFEAYRKIRNELYGEEGLRHRLTSVGKFQQQAQYYKGICCLDALANMLSKLIVGENIGGGFRGITNAFQKLYEHRYMMIISLKYVLKNWEKAIKSNAAECISTYEECCNIVEKWVKMAIKYELTTKTEILERILTEIPEVYEREYNCLNEFVNNCIDWDKFHDYYV